MADPKRNARPAPGAPKNQQAADTSHSSTLDATDVAEAAVLGAALLSRQARQGLVAQLTARHFRRDAHATVWDVIRQLEDEDQHVDTVTATAALIDRNKLDEIGGPDALSTLTDPMRCPSPAAWSSYAAIVIREAHRRRLRRLLWDAAGRLDRGDHPTVVADDLAREVAA
jgi:replicative DNA helicase